MWVQLQKVVDTVSETTYNPLHIVLHHSEHPPPDTLYMHLFGDYRDKFHAKYGPSITMTAEPKHMPARLSNPHPGFRELNKEGYAMIMDLNPFSGTFSRQISEHIAFAELALGKKLPKGSVVHHWDKNRSNNIETNLLICQNQSYHALIHKRMRAYDACGSGRAHWEICRKCHVHGNPTTMTEPDKKGRRQHKDCNGLE